VADLAQHRAAHRRQEDVARWLLEHDGATSLEIAEGLGLARHHANQAAARLRDLGIVSKLAGWPARWIVVPRWTGAIARGELDMSAWCTCRGGRS
jgi:hypothetical protein